MTVYRCYVEKRKGFAVEADNVCADLNTMLRNMDVASVRILNRYDLENISEADFRDAEHAILSEPQVDDCYEETAPDTGDAWVFAVEYLPGQFDQRADSAAQCIQLSTMKERPLVRTAKVYCIEGTLSDAEKEKIKEALINPVEAREASLEKPSTIIMDYAKPAAPAVLEGFNEMDEAGRQKFHDSYGLAMDLADLEFLQEYFAKEEKREPTITEVRVIDTYWSDHCRHTTFNTILNKVEIEPDYVKKTWDEYLEVRQEVYAGRTPKPITLMDLATIGAKALKKSGKLKDLDESEEINACSVKIKVNVDGKSEDWLLMFKNETHNHPTEIEPFGGAATCLGGAIRDPLSGRAYVYQAMRITGAADPLVPIEDTMKGKLPQKKLCVTAANGYSSYGNQIGLATGHVHEIYHPGYVAKRMEVGAVVGAAPAENVVREVPQPGDVVILLGGRTGRDGCGGATGSSKSHTMESLETCGAEVQKGNAPEERKLQRLFRSREAARMIKRCNDFGAGGVSVAIGELAPGLHIDLNKVPKKYEGLDGTELAISESQERMAVVVTKENAERFQQLADSENLESTVVAEVTDTDRLVMDLDGNTIVNLSRAFLDTNGAKRHADVRIQMPKSDERTYSGDFKGTMEAMVSDLNVASQKGLVDRFYSTIGANTILMPYGGKRQLTPSQAMAARVPALNGTSDTASIMGWGFDPYASSANPYKAAEQAVITSIAKVIAAGGSYHHCWLSFQEFFGHMRTEPERWGLPAAALLGAWKAQMELGCAAIGGKDSMSGTFETIDVPPTLISFAVSTAKTDAVISDEFKAAGHKVWLLRPDYDEDGLPVFDSVKQVFDHVEHLIAEKKALSVWVEERNGAAEGIFKMMLGNAVGFRLADDVDEASLFKGVPGSFLVESEEDIEDGVLLGTTIQEYAFVTKDAVLGGDDLQALWEKKLQPVYPYLDRKEPKHYDPVTYTAGSERHASYKVEHPQVLIPVFPGTNCEWDTAKAFEKYGAEAQIFVIRNRTSQQIEESVDGFVNAIHNSQIIAIPGGFSGGDEPEGSAKLIVSFFRNPRIKEAVSDLLDNREGLMLGICNGFQALIKLGLVPYGKIVDTDEHSATLTFNTIGRHQSMLVRTRCATNNSPWLKYIQPGEVSEAAISHGEGRFVCEPQLLEQLKENGQIAFQYVDFEGTPSSSLRFNPNNSYQAVEGILSPDGRVLGKMGHSERSGKDLYRNLGELHTQELLFKGAVEYFR